MKVHTSCIIYEVGELQNNAAVHEGTTTGASRADTGETRYRVCCHSKVLGQGLSSLRHF